MKRAHAIQSEQANMSQSVGILLTVGDKVWLDTRNMSTAYPSKKLDWKRIGQYEITEGISPRAYQIKLPSQLQIYNVQPISRLERSARDPVALQKQEPPPQVIVEEEEEYEVERIDDSRLFRRQFQIL
jgi:hypothetical protein